jgi:hypothetical protein
MEYGLNELVNRSLSLSKRRKMHPKSYSGTIATDGMIKLPEAWYQFRKITAQARQSGFQGRRIAARLFDRWHVKLLRCSAPMIKASHSEMQSFGARSRINVPNFFWKA